MNKRITGKSCQVGFLGQVILAVEKGVGTPPLLAALADVMNKRVGSGFDNIGVGRQVKTNREQGIGIKAFLRADRNEMGDGV